MIYCLEDDLNIRDLVVYALNNSGLECRGFGAATEFYTALAEAKPDLVLLDIMLPGEDGYSVLERLRRNPETEHLAVIMLTAKGAEYDKIKGLNLGADDYVSKPFSVMELIARIKAVLRRVAPQEERELVIGSLRLNPRQHRVYADGEEVVLTHREFQLLCFLMENHDIVLSRDTLLERVWGYDYHGETRTVDVHIRTLRQKLGGEGERIETVRGVGYRISLPHTDE
ncbi:MAG: response regulator transcription factor [Bacillota bacterium]|nr:response regulator transcription factor [Bacillota bacterium]